MKRKKLLTAGICLILISSLIITAAAVVKYSFTSSAGKTIIETVNRIDIKVSATEFTYEDVGQDGMLTCTTTVSLRKTEPDFYGQLHSVTVSGADFGYTVYTAGKNNGTALLPQEVALPSEKPLEWEITFTVPYIEGQNTYDLSLDINYTTGIKVNTNQRYMTNIPIKLTVEA